IVTTYVDPVVTKHVCPDWALPGQAHLEKLGHREFHVPGDHADRFWRKHVDPRVRQHLLSWLLAQAHQAVPPHLRDTERYLDLVGPHAHRCQVASMLVKIQDLVDPRLSDKIAIHDKEGVLRTS